MTPPTLMRSSLISALAVAVAAVVAWRLGGRLGAGTLAGFLLGAGASGLGVLYLGHTMRFRPERTMQALLAAFLAKLGLLVAGALAFRYVAAASERVDWKGFVVAFAAAAALILPLGAWETLAGLRSRGRTLDAERVR